MRKTKQKHDWPNLLSYQKDSGLSVAGFCSINKISTSSLYLNKQQSPYKSNFVKAKVVRRVSEQVTQVTKTTQTITLITSAGELSFPETVTSDFLANLVKGLSWRCSFHLLEDETTLKVIESDKANNLVPFDYLYHVINVLSEPQDDETLNELLPWNVSLPLR